MNEIDLSLVDWSRAQFALTAIYHWFFVPLTLGLSFIIAVMETLYVRTGNEEWKKITRFWMTLFGINFAIGVATGIILEFEFGTNWSNYSWMVGDIFGAPLAIEGIMAFFLESTFIAVMFFGWNKVSKRFHLISTWLVAIGSNLSALWILVANAWMQHPVGMHFNPDTARNEMVNFWDVFLSPVAINKFLHTVGSGYVVGSLFVAGISSWYLLKKRNIRLAQRSLVIASVFGLFSTIFLAFTGDGSAFHVAQKQPMKLAAMEGLYDGQEGADLVVFGILNHKKKAGDDQDTYVWKISIPRLLSILGYRDRNAFVAGINDIVYGNMEKNIEPVTSKMIKGKQAILALAEYKEAKKRNDKQAMNRARIRFENYFPSIGYGYLDKPESIIPNIPLVFYSFHIMAGLGFYFIALFATLLLLVFLKKIEKYRLILRMTLFSLPLGYLASELGWVVSETGRQPWVIQDILPTWKATSHISVQAVQTTFWMFAVLFTVLLLVELNIMLKQIKNGPKEE